MNALAKTVLWGVCAILKKTQYLQTSTVDCKICKPIILILERICCMTSFSRNVKTQNFFRS